MRNILLPAITGLFIILSCSKVNTTIPTPTIAPSQPAASVIFYTGNGSFPLVQLSSNLVSSTNMVSIQADGTDESWLELNVMLSPPDNNDTFTGYGTAIYSALGYTLQSNNVFFTVIFGDSNTISGTFSASDWGEDDSNGSQKGFGNFTNVSINL